MCGRKCSGAVQCGSRRYCRTEAPTHTVKQKYRHTNTTNIQTYATPSGEEDSSEDDTYSRTRSPVDDEGEGCTVTASEHRTPETSRCEKWGSASSLQSSSAESHPPDSALLNDRQGAHKANSGDVAVVDGRGSSPGVRGNFCLQQVVPKPGAANNTSFSRFAALETKAEVATDGHVRLYQRGMKIIDERKKLSEEMAAVGRSTSTGKQRPISANGFLPGHHMRARAKSVPRQRQYSEGADYASCHEAATPRAKMREERSKPNVMVSSVGKRLSRQPFRPGGTPLCSAGWLREQMSPSELRSKSVPRERSTTADGTHIPAFERLFDLACKSSPTSELGENSSGLVKTPWLSGGTNWKRAERQRQNSSESGLSCKLDRSHLNRSKGENVNFQEPIYERLYQSSLAKMHEMQEKEEARRHEQEEHDKFATRRRRLISARSEELLVERENESGACVFDKLYGEGIQKCEERQRLHEERLKVFETEALLARQSKFMPGQTVKAFEPDLSKKSRCLDRREPWDARIDTIIEQKKQQDEANKLEAQLYELSQCTFRPQISKFAATYKRDSKESLSVHEALFEDAKVWRKKQQSPCSSPIAVKRVTKKEEEVYLICARFQLCFFPPPLCVFVFVLSTYC